MDPKMVTAAFEQISKAYGIAHEQHYALEAERVKMAEEILSLRKNIAARDREIDELKKQRDADLPRLAREIDGWKAKHSEKEKELSISKTYAESTSKLLSEANANLASETARADALAAKYDPQIQAELAAKAEAERLRLIAELEAKLKALKKED